MCGDNLFGMVTELFRVELGLAELGCWFGRARVSWLGCSGYVAELAELIFRTLV